MDQIQTHYDTLKVARDAPLEVIRGAYKGLSQKYHPDKNPGPDAEGRMALINDAYRTLANPLTRIDHDKWIREQEGQFAHVHVPEPALPHPACAAGIGGASGFSVGAGIQKKKRWQGVCMLGAAVLVGYGIASIGSTERKAYYPVSANDALTSSDAALAAQPFNLTAQQPVIHPDTAR